MGTGIDGARPGAQAGGGVAGGSPGAGPGGSLGTSGPGSNPGACAPRLPPRLILLSDYQHLNSLKALLGASAVSATDAAEHTAQTKPFTQKGVVVNTSLVHTRMGWAEGASKSFAARFSELTGCDAGKADDACAQRFLSSFAAQAFRRPVEAEEITDLMAVYNVGKTTSFANGVQRAVEALLSSPSFMYRRELGKPDGTGGLTLSAHELASELSFLLTDAPPDADLAKAAEQGALSSDAEVAKQVERLLAKDATKSALTSTLISAWGISNLFGTVKDPKLFPEFTAELQASMFRETEMFVRDVLWDRAAPVTELLTSQKTFVNKPLATIYGIPFTGQGDAFVPVTLPAQRSGLLTQASVLSALARTDTTSVVARGLFVRGLLCLPKLPGPPESLADEIQNLLKADMTERQRAEARKMNATCAGCHAGIDPFGLLLESYDPVGRYRTMLKGMPIDASAEIHATATLSGNFPDAVSFSKAAAQSPELSACISTRLLAYATQDEELRASDCQVQGVLGNMPPSQVTMPQLVKAVTASAALRARTKESP